MSKLICDICGTSYSDGVDKCPTCGYSRAFEEDVFDDVQRPAVREKVRGGRFSKKNVRKRLALMAKAGHKHQDPVPASDLAEELSTLVASMTDAQSAAEAVQAFDVPTCVDVEIPVIQEPEAETQTVRLPEVKDLELKDLDEAPVEAEPVVIVLPNEEEPVRAAEHVEEPEAVEEPIVIVLPEETEPEQEAEEVIAEEPAPEAEPVVIVLPEEAESEQEAEEVIAEEPAPEAEPVVIVLPEEAEPEQEAEEVIAEEPAPETEPIVIVLPEKEEPVQEETETAAEECVREQETDEQAADAEETASENDVSAVAAVVIPEVENAEQEDTSAADEPVEEEKKKKGGLLLNVVLYTALAVFLASAIYLLVTFGIPYLQNMDWPTQPVAETTMPTEEPTQAPTDAPTEAPTDAPTEAPTDPPTEAPTDPPTDPPTEAPTEAPTEPLLDVKLELNYYDLTFGASNQGTQLEAKTIPNEDITWISDDPSIVSVSETGKIISISGGKTTVRAIYGDQEVTVKINCAF